MDGGIWVAILVPICSLIATAYVLVVAITNRNKLRTQERELLSKERLVAIEKGINLPIIEAPHSSSKRNPLQTGLFMLLVGLGLCPALYYANDRSEGAWTFGFVVMLAGLANLIFWHMAGKQEWQSRLNAEKAVNDAYLSYLQQLSVTLKSNG